MFTVGLVVAALLTVLGDVAVIIAIYFLLTRLPGMHRYARGVAVIYGAFWVFSELVHFVTSRLDWVSQQQMHNQPTPYWGRDGFVIYWLSQSYENYKSEWMQLLFQVLVLAAAYYVGSSQSRDSDDRLEAKVDYLLKLAHKDPSDFNTYGEDQGKTVK